ncbi:hypothetical protein BDP27DRAFT_1370126 [Rhodocollybia butyracea]|uniref:Uncharacterized protein n=1 Tax=Rhodocollybia butyracea TaxID=206335 RepID=A0A9P5TZJ4_9AGAR|nr:hypothetical protein BDP27DRAFT_1370126 [Rhodocollybia butyracea]
MGSTPNDFQILCTLQKCQKNSILGPKGFWAYQRDVIENQIKKNAERQKELIIRLSSLDIEGLGLGSKLAGSTIVNHYGSLTGSDFRKIAQVAPFVLKQFVSDECFATWVALSKLIPLIWQPEIKELGPYLTTLENEIQNFLLCVACWTIRWFNKPKFHILVHLPEHIRRFGPAILFATEGFESFNANRLHHLLSGALFLDREKIPLDVEGDKRCINCALHQRDRITATQRHYRLGNFTRDHLAQAGPSTLELVKHSADTVGHYLGLVPPSFSAPSGTCALDTCAATQQWPNTLSGRHIPASPIFDEEMKSNSTFHCAKGLVPLANGDKCPVESFVACQNLGTGHATDGVDIAHVKEILWRYRPNAMHKVADVILVEAYQMLLCTANVQHNCTQNPCTIEHDAPVPQEHEQTAQFKGQVHHRGNFNDLVLNTAQMRDAKYIQRFRITPQPLPLDHTLDLSTARVWDLENKKTKTQKPRSTPISLQPRPPSPLAVLSPSPLTTSHHHAASPALQPRWHVPSYSANSPHQEPRFREGSAVPPILYPCPHVHLQTLAAAPTPIPASFDQHNSSLLQSHSPGLLFPHPPGLPRSLDSYPPPLNGQLDNMPVASGSTWFDRRPQHIPTQTQVYGISPYYATSPSGGYFSSYNAPLQPQTNPQLQAGQTPSLDPNLEQFSTNASFERGF